MILLSFLNIKALIIFKSSQLIIIMINKFLLVILLITCIFTSKAQTRIGIKGGANIANVYVTSGNESSSGDAITTFHIGALLESRFTDKILFQPNLLFSQKGFSEKPTNKATVNYIELPVNLLYEISRNFTFGGGIYGAYAINGKGTLNGKSYDYDFSKGKANRFDLGVNLIIGYEVIDGIRLNVNYTHGFANTVDNVNLNITNRVLGFSVIALWGER